MLVGLLFACANILAGTTAIASGVLDVTLMVDDTARPRIICALLSYFGTLIILVELMPAKVLASRLTALRSFTARAILYLFLALLSFDYPLPRREDGLQAMLYAFNGVLAGLAILFAISAIADHLSRSKRQGRGIERPHSMSYSPSDTSSADRDQHMMALHGTRWASVSTAVEADVEKDGGPMALPNFHFAGTDKGRHSHLLPSNSYSQAAPPLQARPRSAESGQSGRSAHATLLGSPQSKFQNLSAMAGRAEDGSDTFGRKEGHRVASTSSSSGLDLGIDVLGAPNVGPRLSRDPFAATTGTRSSLRISGSRFDESASHSVEAPRHSYISIASSYAPAPTMATPNGPGDEGSGRPRRSTYSEAVSDHRTSCISTTILVSSRESPTAPLFIPPKNGSASASASASTLALGPKRISETWSNKLRRTMTPRRRRVVSMAGVGEIEASDTSDSVDGDDDDEVQPPTSSHARQTVKGVAENAQMLPSPPTSTSTPPTTKPRLSLQLSGPLLSNSHSNFLEPESSAEPSSIRHVGSSRESIDLSDPMGEGVGGTELKEWTPRVRRLDIIEASPSSAYTQESPAVRFV